MGSTVDRVCGQQSDYGVRTQTFTNKCEAERKKAVKQPRAHALTTQQIQSGQGRVCKSGNARHLIVSHLILLRLSASGSHRYTVNHRLRAKKPFYRLITYGEKHNCNPYLKAR